MGWDSLPSPDLHQMVGAEAGWMQAGQHREQTVLPHFSVTSPEDSRHHTSVVDNGRVLRDHARCSSDPRVRLSMQ